jgi:O-succinylbenzoic acid--CoA ligase
MTEASSQIATTMPEDAIHKVGTVGKPLMFTEVRVVDESGEKQQTGKYGEILVKGPTVMQGYYGDEDATKKALKDGWLHTGDIGYFDEDGDLFLVQRRSDLIVSGGENVYPSEVEAVLRKHPSIKEVAVVGISDAEWGQKVAAAIILENGESMTEAELETYSREHLAAYKIPRIVKFVDALPMTGSGKIQRNGVKGFFAK